jgi:hypothetical protein
MQVSITMRESFFACCLSQGQELRTPAIPKAIPTSKEIQGLLQGPHVATSASVMKAIAAGFGVGWAGIKVRM